MKPQAKLEGSVQYVGFESLQFVRSFGDFCLLCVATWRSAFRRNFPARELLVQMDSIGVRSLVIVGITALFTGLVLALQTVDSLTRFGAKPYTGSLVGLAIVLEMGPVLTALMVGGRVGSGITAEIGSMVVTEQVDAIRSMGADPIQKLVLPRMLAVTISLPLLTILADIIGILGGLMIALQHGITRHFYFQTIFSSVTLDDFISGVAKTIVFGWIIAMVACANALATRGGTVGVGHATKRTVVIASISVLVSDFFLTKILLTIL